MEGYIGSVVVFSHGLSVTEVLVSVVFFYCDEKYGLCVMTGL